MDKYLVEMNRIVTGIEQLCGVTDSDENGQEIGKLPISSVLAYFNKKVKGMSKDEFAQFNREVSKFTVLLSYSGSKLYFYGKNKLDFTMYPCIDKIAETLTKFTTKNSITPETFSKLDEFAVILSEVDSKDPTVRAILSYRFMRVFLLLILCNSYCNAGIVADFILNQMIPRG